HRRAGRDGIRGIIDGEDSHLMKAIFKTAWLYQKDVMNLPVANVEAALPFYETVMGFQVVSRADAPHQSAVLARDETQIGLAENGGDSSQDGCFFAADDVEAAFAELQANGLGKKEADSRFDRHGDTTWKVFL